MDSTLGGVEFACVPEHKADVLGKRLFFLIVTPIKTALDCPKIHRMLDDLEVGGEVQLDGVHWLVEYVTKFMFHEGFQYFLEPFDVGLFGGCFALVYNRIQLLELLLHPFLFKEGLLDVHVVHIARRRRRRRCRLDCTVFCAPGTMILSSGPALPLRHQYGDHTQNAF